MTHFFPVGMIEVMVLLYEMARVICGGKTHFPSMVLPIPGHIENIAISQGLKIALELGFSSIIVDSDALNVSDL